MKRRITDEEYREAACKRVDGMADISIWTDGDVKHAAKLFGESTEKAARVKRNPIGAYIQAWVYVQNDWVEESDNYSPEAAKAFSVEGKEARAFLKGFSAAKEVSNFVETIKTGEPDE